MEYQLNQRYQLVDKDLFFRDLKKVYPDVRPMWVGKHAEAIIYINDRRIRIKFWVSANNRVNILKIIGFGNNKKGLAELEQRLQLVRIPNRRIPYVN